MWTHGINGARTQQPELDGAQLRAWLSPIDAGSAAVDVRRLFGCHMETLPPPSRDAVPFIAAVLRDVHGDDGEIAAWLAAPHGAASGVALLQAGMVDDLTRQVIRHWNRSATTEGRALSRIAGAISAVAGVMMIAVLWTSTAVAQGSPDDRHAMTRVLRYAGVEHVRQADADRLTELWRRAQQPGLSTAERGAAFRDLFRVYGGLHGRDTTASPALEGAAGMATRVFEAGGRMDLTLPPSEPMRDGYIHVATVGDGPTTLLLIADVGIDGRDLYGSFIERHHRDYTMHVVTLPFAGAAQPLPWPAVLDFAARPWLTQIERELTALVDQPRMRGAVVIGTAAGGYFAAKLALARPDRIQGAMLVNALSRVELRSPDNPAAPATAAQRLAAVRASVPAPQLWPVGKMPPSEEMKRLIADTIPKHPFVQNWFAFAVRDTAVSRPWTLRALSGGFFLPSNRYGRELTSTDLTDEMATLRIPVLALSSRHDAGSPVKTFPGIVQWEEVRQRYPAIPLSTAVVDQARQYLSADAPGEFDRQLEVFVARKR